MKLGAIQMPKMRQLARMLLIPRARWPLPGRRDQANPGNAGSGGPGPLVGFPSQRQRLLVAAIAAACALAIPAFQLLGPDAGGNSRLPRIPNMDSTPGGERQRDSEHYQRTLNAANERMAEAAAADGKSYISVPETLLDQIPDQTRPPADRTDDAVFEGREWIGLEAAANARVNSPDLSA